MSSGTPTELTTSFGVEIEFALACLVEGQEDPQKDDLRPVYVLLGSMGEIVPATFQVETAHQQKALNMHVHKHIVKTLQDIGLKVKLEREVESVEEKWQMWIVTEDGSIDPPRQTGGHLWAQVEVISPACVSCEAAVQGVLRVYGVLAASYRVNCNESCGFHIHVGNGITGFDTNTIRNLMAIIWTFEEQFEELHPRHRFRHGAYSASLWNFRTQGKDLDKEDTFSRIPILETVLQSGDKEEIIELVRGYGRRPDNRLAYNVVNLSDKSTETIKKTIEFRHHEATLGREQVKHWIQTCVGLVEFAHKVDSSKLAAFLRKNVDLDMTQCTVTRVLEAIGLHDEVLYYAWRLEEEGSEMKQKQSKMFKPKQTGR